ncbi:MAG: outer membrane lipoprotein-sorting protein [Verrucomicrobiales bacterium]|jgi:hypothetical protein|nr:outer membrane lipoprotein-sorting protein [Verrucomicrobiales bacterium]MDF1785139.1 outer membrane lipoprotein-sorting protein [Verrucomicrobiales bacterium]
MKSFLLSFLCLAIVAFAENPVAADPKAHEVLDKFIEASGGEDAFKKIKTRVAEGQMSLPAMGMKMKIKLSQKAPDKVHMEQGIEGLLSGKQGYDGETGWSEDSIQGFRKLSGAELAQLQRESNIRRELNLKADFPGMKLLPEVEIDGKKVSVIEATSKDDRKETWYFDQESHLMVKMEQTMTLGPQGELAVTITLKDYKEVDGIKLPMTSEVKNPAFTGVLTLSSVKHNVDLDDALFASPQKDKKKE